MANAGLKLTQNGSQLFIVQADETPWLNGKHTVFGQVIEGTDVVDKIAKASLSMYDKPREDVKVKRLST